MKLSSDHSVEPYQTFVRTLIDRTRTFSIFKKDRRKEIQHIIKETTPLKAFSFLFLNKVKENCLVIPCAFIST